MELREVEELVSELETRVDRLRALYDQYFMGFEKLEPTVPRKDVDRRIHDLRKFQFRNTGIRFRFHMIIQRYNTYQTFWARICRQIEDGTYKRHALRAEARFGVDKRGRRVKHFEEDVNLDELDDEIKTVPPPPLPDSAEQPAPFAIPSAPRPIQRAYEDVSLDADFVVPVDAIELDYQEFGQVPHAPPPPAPRLPFRSEPGTGPGRVWRKVGGGPASGALPPIRSAAPSSPDPFPARGPAAAVPGAIPPRGAPAPAPPPFVRPAAPIRQAPRVSSPDPTGSGASGPRRGDGELPDERVRQLYTQYVETKRRRNESTAAITFDGLAKSLRDSSAKLRAQHGKSVDFEVTVKDGKTVIRPVVKS